MPEQNVNTGVENQRTSATPAGDPLVADITFIISIMPARGIIHSIHRLTDVAAAVEHNRPFENKKIKMYDF